MPLVLHNAYTPDQATAELAEGRRADTFCDGQFRVASNVILCFFTLGGTSKSILTSPSSLEWRPSRLDCHPSEELPWFPLAARETSPLERITSDQNLAKRLRLRSDEPEPKRLPPKKHHLFLRDETQSVFLYAGEAHLAGYSMSAKKPEARFDLSKPLPREAWLRFGGYEGWLVTVDHEEARLPQYDVARLEQLLDALKEVECGHVELTRYEEDTLFLYSNPTRAWIAYLRRLGDNCLFIDNVNETPEPREHFACTCGIDLDFPRDRTLPLEEGLKIVTEFFRTGQLSTQYIWTDKEES